MDRAVARNKGRVRQIDGPRRFQAVAPDPATNTRNAGRYAAIRGLGLSLRDAGDYQVHRGGSQLQLLNP